MLTDDPETKTEDAVKKVHERAKEFDLKRHNVTVDGKAADYGVQATNAGNLGAVAKAADEKSKKDNLALLKRAQEISAEMGNFEKDFDADVQGVKLDIDALRMRQKTAQRTITALESGDPALMITVLMNDYHYDLADLEGKSPIELKDFLKHEAGDLAEEIKRSAKEIKAEIIKIAKDAEVELKKIEAEIADLPDSKEKDDLVEEYNQVKVDAHQDIDDLREELDDLNVEQTLAKLVEVAILETENKFRVLNEIDAAAEGLINENNVQLSSLKDMQSDDLAGLGATFEGAEEGYLPEMKGVAKAQFDMAAAGDGGLDAMFGSDLEEEPSTKVGTDSEITKIEITQSSGLENFGLK